MANNLVKLYNKSGKSIEVLPSMVESMLNSGFSEEEPKESITEVFQEEILKESLPINENIEIDEVFENKVGIPMKYLSPVSEWDYKLYKELCSEYNLNPTKKGWREHAQKFLEEKYEKEVVEKNG